MSWTPAALAQIGLKPTILSIYAGNDRVVVVRSSVASQHILRVTSCSRDSFSLPKACAVLNADPGASTIIVFSNTEPDAAVVADSILPNGTTVIPSTISEARPEYRHVFAEHLRESGNYIREQFGFKVPPALPPAQQRIWDRLGDNGYELLAAQSVFSSGRAACRLMAESYLAFKRAPRKRRRDELARLQLAWNIVVRAFIAVENLGAFYEALRSTIGGDYTAFATTFLRYGHTDPAFGQHTIHNTFQRLASQDGPKDIARTFSVPLHRGQIKEYGLEGCDIDPDKLVGIGIETQSILVERFRRLTPLILLSEAPSPGEPFNPQKSPTKRAYDSVHHGFSHVLPVLAPYPQSISVRGTFLDDEVFSKQIRTRDFAGEMLLLNTRTAKVQRVFVPATIEDIKRFAHAVFGATFLLHELCKYATDKFGSTSGCMPYLIDSSVHLNPDERQALSACLRRLRE